MSILKIEEEKCTALSPLVFGSFIEHIVSCISGGIYDESSPLSDEKGIRQDVLTACRELAPTILRFPGGTVTSIYHWEDYVGPIEQRKKMKNLIWGGMMCRQFGTGEYIEYCRKIGAEPMICVNMPSGTPEEAAHWVEYCNCAEDTYYANLRRKHGYEEPFGVKYWCIGNESYSVQDLGMQNDVSDYVKQAWEFVKYMKLTDDSIKIVLVGDAGCEEWNRAVLEHMSPVCDYLSVHFYTGNTEGPQQPYQALEEFSSKLDRLADMLDQCNRKDEALNEWYRIGKRRNPIRLALDEWNLWNVQGDRQSNYGLLMRYSWQDALWTACFLNMMIRRADMIGIANLSEMVNVMAPILADRQGCCRQTTFYPLKYYRELAGSESAGFIYDGEGLDISVTKEGDIFRIFAVNVGACERCLKIEVPVEMAVTLYCEDPLWVNSMEKDGVKVQTEYEAAKIVAVKGMSICIITARR